MSEYYLISLNHNDNLDKTKLKNIIYKGIYYDIPFAFEESKAYELYEDIEIMVYRSLFGFKDILTGEIVVESFDGNIDSLSYNKIRVASSDDIIRITNQYKKMSKEDRLRYKEKILSIKNKSISLFKEKEILKNQIIAEHKYALDYLNTLQNYNIEED